MARFTDLPFELCRIILLLACEPTRDPRWLLDLPRTSRMLYAVAEPVLYETAWISRRNRKAILATCGLKLWWRKRVDAVARVLPSRDSERRTPTIDDVPFQHTRHLIVLDWRLDLSLVSWAFVRITAFAGTRRQLEQMAEQGDFAPTTLVLTEQCSDRHLQWLLHTPAVRTVTHLRMCVAGWNSAAGRAGVPPRRAPPSISHAGFTHIVIDYHAKYDWRDFETVATTLLALPSMQRLLVCLEPREDLTGSIRALQMLLFAITELVVSKQGTRLWSKSTDVSEGGDHCRPCPCHLMCQDLATVFDRSKWVDGEPVIDSRVTNPR